MSVAQKRTIWGVGVALTLIATVVVVAVALARRPAVKRDEGDAVGTAMAVRAVHPSKDSSLRISVRQLLSVEAFIKIDLRSQVPGQVKQVPRSVNAEVRAGELLVEIAVPDLDQVVLEKAAVIQQRIKDVALARAQLANTDAQVAVTRELIDQRMAERDEAIEMRNFRELRSERFALAEELKGIQKNMADEERRYYRAAIFAVNAAESAVRRARADLTEKLLMVQVARTDVELKEALVEVARKDYAEAQARVEYSRIVAPFSGQVVNRNVNEGDFVQNASTSEGRPLITLARTDIVTVVMKVPDSYAPYVTRDTEATLEFDGLPDVVMHGRVTRFSPAIRSSDRTMHVEVDLWNDTPEKYARYETRCVRTWLSPLAAAGPLELAPLMAASDRSWSKNCKDRSDPLPMLPIIRGVTDKPLKLLPGTSGYMRLNLRQFKDSYLLPSSAVYFRGGKPYILEVRDGMSHMVPVRVQVTDGRHSKVAVIVQDADPVHGQPEVLHDLTGDETIILNRQLEVGDNQPVEVSLEGF
jgi:multidrug resistance efflux pump